MRLGSVEDLKEVVRARLKANQDLSRIKADLLSEGHAQEDVDKAVALFDWKSERKEYKGSGGEQKDQQMLEAVIRGLLLKRLAFVAAIIVFFFIFGPLSLIFWVLVVVCILGISSVGARGIH